MFVNSHARRHFCNQPFAKFDCKSKYLHYLFYFIMATLCNGGCYNNNNLEEGAKFDCKMDKVSDPRWNKLIKYSCNG